MSTGGDSYSFSMVLDNSRSIEAAREQIRQLRMVEDAAIRTARAQEDSSNRAATRQEQTARRTTRIQEDLARQLQRTQEDAAMRAAEAQRRNMGMAGQAAGILAAGVGRIVSQFGAMAIAGQVIADINQAFVRGHQILIESIDWITQYRENLLELAALRNQLGQPGGLLAQNLELAAETLLPIEQAVQLQTGIAGSVDTAIKTGQIEQKTVEAVTIEVGKRMAAFGERMPGRSTAQFVGTIPSLLHEEGAPPVGEKQVMDLFDRSTIIFMNSAIEMEHAIDAIMKNMGPIKAGVYSTPEEAMVSIATLGETGLERTGTEIGHEIRATVYSAFRERGAKLPAGMAEEMLAQGLDPEVEMQRRGTWIQGLLKQAGMTKEEGLKVDILKPLMFADYERAKKERSGLGFTEFLAEKGYGGAPQDTAVLQKGYEEQARSAAHRKVQFDEALHEENRKLREEFHLTDVGAARQKQVMQDQKKVIIGMGEDYWRQLIEAQFDQMVIDEESLLGVPLAGQADEFMAPAIFNIPQKSRQAMVQERAKKSLIAEAERVGLGEEAAAFDIATSRQPGGGMLGGKPPADLAEEARKLRALIVGAGGDQWAGLGAQRREQAGEAAVRTAEEERARLEANRLLREINQNGQKAKVGPRIQPQGAGPAIPP